MTALGLALGGAFAGILSAILLDPVYTSIAPPDTPAGSILFATLVQPGFGLFAALYVWLRGTFDGVFTVSVPTREGLLWIAAGPFLYEGLTSVTRHALTTIGIETAPHTGPATWEVLLTNPLLILPAFVLYFVLMVPMEEFLYRGVIHAELTPAFGAAGRVVLGALLFGLMHLVVSQGVPSLVLTAAGGLAFATAYERTDNLVVPASMHALYWVVI